MSLIIPALMLLWLAATVVVPMFSDAYGRKTYDYHRHLLAWLWFMFQFVGFAYFVIFEFKWWVLVIGGGAVILTWHNCMRWERLREAHDLAEREHERID